MQEEQFCEIILILDQWFRRRCHLKYFLSGNLAALVFVGAELFSCLGRGHYCKPSCEVILNLDLWFRKRCCLKKKVTDEQTHDTRRPIRIAHLGSGELTKMATQIG